MKPRVSRKGRKFFDVLRLNGGDENALWLCHSHRDRRPDAEDGGHYIPGQSIIWAKAGQSGTWTPTNYRSKAKAMDDVLGCSLATQAVALLVEGEYPA